MRDLKKLKGEIDAELTRIWMEEPGEIKKLFSGISDSGAGSYGQYFSTLVLAEGEVRGLGFHGYGRILQVIDDSQFDLSHIRKISRMLIPVSAEFLGYIGLTKIWEFSRRFLILVDKADDRDELRGLVRSLLLYVNRMHGWVHFYFPWGLGTQFRLKTEKDLGKMRNRTTKKIR